MRKRTRRHNASSDNPLTQIFTNASSHSSKHASQDGWLTKYLLPLGSVLIAALTFLTQNVQIPRLAIAAAVAYLTVVAAVSLYGPAIRFLSLVSERLRMTRLARKSLPELEETVRQLQRMTGRDYGDSLVYLIRDIGQWAELKDLLLSVHDQEHLETLTIWLSSVDSRIADAGTSEFHGLCREVSNLVTQYHRFCIQRHRILQDAISSGKLAEPRLRNLKQQWNVRREGHMALIRNWINVADRINEIAGSKFCHEYYESLGTLE